MALTTTIVKFEDGSYGIRRYVFPFGYEFKEITRDINTNWWGTDFGSFSSYCKSTDLNKVQKIFKDLTDKGVPYEG